MDYLIYNTNKYLYFLKIGKITLYISYIDYIVALKENDVELLSV